MDLVFHLKREVDKLKAQMEELKTQSVEKVAAQAFEGFNDRLTRLEERLRGLEIVHGIITTPEEATAFATHMAEKFPPREGIDFENIPGKLKDEAGE